VQAGEQEHVLQAVRGAGGEIRAKLGESLSSIQKLDRPFQQVTTPSLEAFQAFALGVEESASHGSFPALPFVQRAIELDPDFALAYYFQGTMYNNVGDLEIRDEYKRKAFSLIGRVNSERERLTISAGYYLVTGQTDKEAETARVWAQTYPRDDGPHDWMGALYFETGEFERALQEYQEVIRLERKPDGGDYSNVILTDTALERFEEARAVAQKAFAQKLDAPAIHYRLLGLANTEGDRAAAAKELQWFTGKPEESRSLALQAWDAYSLGQRRKARKLAGRAKELYQRHDLASAAARVVVVDALSDAVLGNCEAARSTAETAALPYQNRDFLTPAILGLALCGQDAQAERIANKISKEFPMDTLWHAVKLPAIQASVELKRNHAARAIELLQSAAPYERAYPYVMYLRGLAYLEAREADKASFEFRKILDHKGAYWMSLSLGPYFPLSYLGLARAATMSGDTAKARRAYQDLFALWKDADPDLLPLIQARKEYATLP
jgi:tetratricopeptide (TPR) repeat protein